MNANAGIPMGHWAKDAQIRAAGVLLVTPDGRALFLRRSGQGDHPGEWSIPGGHIEPNEIPVQAALRELKEETGIGNIDPSALRVAGRTNTPDVDYTTFLIQVPKAIEPRLNDEHNGHAWVPLEVPPKPTHPGLAATIKSMGKDEKYDEETPMAPEAAELNSTTMDGYLDLMARGRPHSREAFVLKHGRSFGHDLQLAPGQVKSLKGLTTPEQAEAKKALKAVNKNLTRDPKESWEKRDHLESIVGKETPGVDAEDDKEHPKDLQQAEFPVFLMCAPFSLSTDKPDNIWMKQFAEGSSEVAPAGMSSETDKGVAFKEWMKLYSYLAQQALVYVLPSEEGLQDQVYVANLGLVLPHKKDKEVIVANFKAPPRRGEDKIGGEIFKQLGYKVAQAPKYWEGEAECKYIRDNLFVGAYGMRSSYNSIEWLEDNHGMKIIPVEMLEERLYHLDTLLFPLTSEKVITCTGFMKPRDVRELEKHVEIIDISREDTLRGLTCGIKLGNTFLCNTLLETLKDKDELYEDEVNKAKTIEKICSANGLDYKLFNLSEAEKSGADLACHIMHLNWVEANSPTGSAIKPDQK